MNKSVFDLITENLATERLDDILLQNTEYIKIMGSINALEERLSECGIAEDARRLIGELESEYLTLNSFYAKTAYLQGFKDCASLLAETGLLKQPYDYMGRKGVFQA